MTYIDNIKNIVKRLQKTHKLKKIFGNKKILPDSIDIPGKIDVFFPENLSIGNGVYIGPDAIIDARGGVVFGSNIIIASRVMVFSYNHDYKNEQWTPYSPDVIPKAVTVGNNVWIGAGSILCPGCVVGNDCVIGAGSVVRGCISDNSVVAGNPAKKVGDVPSKLTDAIQYQLVMAKLRRWG